MVKSGKTKERWQEIRVVDLFCGGGGLSCGFDYYRGSLHYKTVLGVDNEPAAIRIFNQNFLPSAADARLDIGRVADVTWFSHPTEIKLFYLVHLASTTDDRELNEGLSQIGVEDFLRCMRAVDSNFNDRLAELCLSEGFITAIGEVPNATFSLALPKALLARLGLVSFSRPKTAASKLPWIEEYSRAVDINSDDTPVTIKAEDDLVASSAALWEQRTFEIAAASERTGRGQHKNNAARLSALAKFIQSEHGQALRDAWVEWRALRDTVRAHFCLEMESEILRLYEDGRRVHAVLGGPPCKGFSRIGRPVIQDLRNQGVHAWSHKDFGDERNALMIQYVLFIEALAPDIFVFENVSNFQSELKTPSGSLDAPALLEELIDDLGDGELHYHIHHRLVNSREFAVPQDRRRFIMFGVSAAKGRSETARRFFSFSPSAEDVPLGVALQGLAEPSVFDSSNGVKADHQSDVYRMGDPKMPKATKAFLDWIQQPDPRTGKCPASTDAHIYRKGREDDRVFVNFVAPGIRWMDLKVDKSETLGELADALDEAAEQVASNELKERLLSLRKKANGSLMLRLLLEHTKERFGLDEQHLLLEGYLKNGGSTHGDWFERLSATKPCRTIVAHIGKDTYAYWHPTEPRSLTIREAARVQSFPDFFKLGAAGVVDTYTVIGNAVPALMAQAFAARIAELHSENSLFSDTELEERDAPSRRVSQIQLAL